VDATKHWNHHDFLLFTLNSILFENYKEDVADIPNYGPAFYVNVQMPEAKSWHSQIPSTVKEQAMIETTFEEARHNMLSHRTLAVLNALVVRMLDIFDATEGVQRMVVE